MAVIVALDVGYEETDGVETGRCGVVAFETWTSSAPTYEVAVDIDRVAPYVAGQLFERELPCLLAGLDALDAALPNTAIECVLVDGNVRLDPQGRPGLGMYLYSELGEKVPVIGVAKNAFAGLDAIEVLRGASSKPLYVTAAGMDESIAAAHIASLHGGFRISTLIRRADQLSRTGRHR